MTVAPALSAEVNNASMSPLYLAVVRKSVGVVRALLQQSHTSAIGPNQQNALHAAVLGSHEIASMLLDWNAELANERDTTGSTPMHYAASSGDVAVMEKMLKKIPWAVYKKDEEGSSPLHVAARMLNYNSIRCIINHCPDSFELRDNHGRNFLHILAQHDGEEINLNDRKFYGHFPMIDFISRSPDLKKLANAKDNDGNTPLHFASKNGISEVILQLLHWAEADPTIMNNEGKTALDHAVSPSTSFYVMAKSLEALSSYGAIFSPHRQDKLQKWIDNTAKWADKASEGLIVVSVLIATVAFSAAFNVPGSYNDDGVANFRENKQFQIFLILDAIAMSASVSATILLVVTKAVSKKVYWASFSTSLILLWISLFAMELAFAVAVQVSLGVKKLFIKGIIDAISVIFFAQTVVIIYISSPLRLDTIIGSFFPTEKTPTARQIDIRCPKLNTYVRISSFFVTLSLLVYVAIFIGSRFPE